MSVSSGRGSGRATARGRSSAKGSSGSARPVGKARQETASKPRPGSASGRKKSASGGVSKPGASAGAAKSSARAGRHSSSRASQQGTDTARQPTNGAVENHALRDAITNVGIPVVTTAIGVAGGVLLGRPSQRSRSVLGFPVPHAKLDLAGVSQQIGEAGRQLGKLAGELRAVREKAQQIGRIIS